jgi:SAM-dependent methyltransferase
MSSQGFFDDQHTTDQLPLPLWFRALRRFEVTRTDVALALLPSGTKLLDVGCGDGELALRARERFSQIVATDVSAAAIAHAERVVHGKPGTPIDFRVLDANLSLPFESGSFDVLVSLSTLQYIFDPELFLRETARVLAKGGKLLIEVPNVAYLPQRLRLLAGLPIRTSFWKHGIDGGNLHYFTLDSLLGLLKEAGFKKLKHTGSGVFAPLRTWRTSLLCGNIFVLAERV